MRYLLFESASVSEVENFIETLQDRGFKVIRNPGLNEVQTEDVILVSTRHFCETCHGMSGIKMKEMIEIMNELEFSGHEVLLVNLEPDAQIPANIAQEVKKFNWFTLRQC